MKVAGSRTAGLAFVMNLLFGGNWAGLPSEERGIASSGRVVRSRLHEGSQPVAPAKVTTSVYRQAFAAAATLASREGPSH